MVTEYFKRTNEMGFCLFFHGTNAISVHQLLKERCCYLNYTQFCVVNNVTPDWGQSTTDLPLTEFWIQYYCEGFILRWDVHDKVLKLQHHKLAQCSDLLMSDRIFRFDQSIGLIWYRLLTVLGLIHTHFVHSIWTSTVNQF